jgi:hypothetical protein
MVRHAALLFIAIFRFRLPDEASYINPPRPNISAIGLSMARLHHDMRFDSILRQNSFALFAQ